MANEAPERIWATEDADNGGEDRFHSTSPFRGGTEYIRADLATLSSDAVAGGEEVAWLRDLDGTGSLHPAAKGDPGAFPVYSAPPEPDQLRDRVKELESLLQEAVFWIEGALTCKSWSWDEDQHEAATDSLQRIRTARRVREGGKVDG